jgi:hypothetical protein
MQKMRDKILTIDLDFGLGFMDLGLLIYIPAYLEEQRRKKVRKIYTCIYVETNRERESKMRSTELAITGANPLTTGVGCRRVVPVERDTERESERERDIRYIYT